jgi:ABC-type dipeptide/oligopeptide/nickel transport system permease component
MLHLIPGDPVLMILRTASANVDLDAIRHQLGLDLPLHVQYWRFLSKALRGDLGQSIFIKRPVLGMIMSELPYTIRLAGLGMIFIIFFGLLFGIVSALGVNSWVDSVIMTVAVSGMSIPDFWLSLLLILLFCVKLGWLPIFELESDSLKVVVLPAFVIGVRTWALISRIVRSGLLEVLGEDYIRTARAKGLAEHVVLLRHALKNALIPVVTVMGLHFGGLLGGAVVVETVFARPGIGHLTITAILQRDYPLAQGTVLFGATIFVLMNLVVDFFYAYIDPRIRYD